MTKFYYKDNIAILVDGKIIKQFQNKLTTSCCGIVMGRHVILKYGEEFNLSVGSFTLMNLKQ
jgi:hypothetical protein